MNPEKPPASRRCFDCGAENDLSVSECWLCHRQDWREGSAGAKPQSLDSRRIIDELHREALVSMAGRIGWVALILMVLGTLLVEPGLAIGLGISAVLMVIPVWGAKTMTKGMSPLVRFFVTMVLSLVFFILLLVALFIALYLICLATGQIH